MHVVIQSSRLQENCTTPSQHAILSIVNDRCDVLLYKDFISRTTSIKRTKSPHSQTTCSISRSQRTTLLPPVHGILEYNLESGIINISYQSIIRFRDNSEMILQHRETSTSCYSSHPTSSYFSFVQDLVIMVTVSQKSHKI